jgi:hypothetical protein
MAEYNANLGEDWSQVAQLLQWERGVQADKRDQAERAIRWQGEQDYKTLVDSGVDPMVAFGRTAPKLFHNDPRGFANAVESMRKPTQATITTLGGREGVMQPSGHFTPFDIGSNRAEPRPIRETTPASPGMPGVSRSYTASEYEAKRFKDAIASKQDEYKSAAELAAASGWNPKTWFGGRGNAIEAMNTSSNLLAQAGVNAQTGKPITSPGPAQMAAPTSAQAQAEIQRRAPAPPSTETVVVIGPNGKRGRIPKIQLNDALNQGFTLPK